MDVYFSFLTVFVDAKAETFFSFTYMLVTNNVYAKVRHKEWRGHPYALNQRGEPRKLEPLLSNKNASRHKRVHSIIQIVQGSQL